MPLFRFVFGLVRFAVKLTLVISLAGAITLVVYTVFWLPDVTSLCDQNPETTAFIERARSRVRRHGVPLKIEQTWVPLEKISKNLTEAVLIAEDDRFYQHKGFDFTEIRISMMENIRAGRWIRGGSTITQQLAKNLYLSPDKTLKRKFDEMILTWKLENNLSKARILELYLNVVEWGEGRFGAEAAAQFYFNKPASRLSGPEAASLAARLPNPDGLGEQVRKKRENMILARMRKQGPRQVPDGPSPPVVQKTPPAFKGPVIPQATRQSPGNPSQVEQIGNLIREKVNQALSQMEKLEAIKITGGEPEEPPKPQQENPYDYGRIAKAQKPGWTSDHSGGNHSIPATPGFEGSPREGNSQTVPQASEKEKVEAPSLQNNMIPVTHPSEEKQIPKKEAPPRTKRLRESLSRLEQALGK